MKCMGEPRRKRMGIPRSIHLLIVSPEVEALDFTIKPHPYWKILRKVSYN